MEMEALSAICAGLGFAEEDENGKRIGYSKGENCLENLKDLLRFLRRDDPQTREVFKQICKWKIVSKDLIPIIQYFQDDRSLVLNAVKVLVFLTMPIEPSSSEIPQQIEYLWDLKSAITYSQTIAASVSLLEGPLENLERESFCEDDWKLVQLVLTLFRNMLAIQDISLLQKVGGSASHLLSLRDKFLELLFHENVMDLILIITQQVSYSSGYLRQDNLLLLEIFHYIFAGQEPESVAKAHLKDSKVGENTKVSLDSLKSLMEEEEKRKLSRLRNTARHSQFSGTFTRVTMDGAKAIYKGNPSSATQNVLLKPHKIQKGHNKKIVWDHGSFPSVKDDILVLLHDFLYEFLSGGYNVLMQTICEDIEKEHHTIQKSDIVIFFQVAQFVTAFQYHKFLTYKPSGEKDSFHSFGSEHPDNTLFNGDICGPIAASMNESMFLLVISRWRNAFDGLKETNDYKFLSAATSLMKIMIRMLDLVLKLLPEDSREPQTARILLYKLFYDQTDQGMCQFLLSLIKSFDSHKQSKSDLADLVEMIHVIVRLMGNLQGRGTLRVSKKSRKVRKKKAPGDKKDPKNGLSGDEVNVQDHTVSTNAEESDGQNMLQKKVQENTTSDDQENVIGDIQVDEAETFVSDMGNLVGKVPQKSDRVLDDDDLSCSSGDSSDEQPPETYEVDFKVSTFISAFANHNIIQNLCWLIKFYKSNSISTNHYIISMLRRITDDLELSPMLYQLSLLMIFYDILDEQKSRPCKEYANIVEFLASLIRRMLRKMKNQPLLFVEALFWKSRRECHYVNAEYLLHELGHMKKETRNWGNVSEEGGNGSTQANGWIRRSLADALGEDEADVVISHEPYQSETNTMEHDIEKVAKRKRRLVLTDELETRIRDLYEKYKDEFNCSRLIAGSLDSSGHISPAQVFNKLKQLGLKVASKKRARQVDRVFSFTSAQPDDKGKTTEKESDLNNSVDFDRTLPSQSTSTRKRVSAFSKDQEEMIKALFEQFKEHKRCSYMIANALAPDNSLTAAQVSRKLKQLGLRIPRQKKSEAKLHLRDEDINESPVGDGHNSDDEPLLSLRKRRRNMDNGGFLSELSKQNIVKSSGNSDDEFLSSVLRHKSKDSKGLFNKAQSNEREMSDSDDEILYSVLKKMKKLPPEAKRRIIPTSITENSGDEILEYIAERDAERIYEDAALDIRPEDASESEEIGGNSRSPSGGSEVLENHNSANQETEEDALADIEIAEDALADVADDDDTAFGSPTTTAPLRRKLRMVIDDAEDD